MPRSSTAGTQGRTRAANPSISSRDQALRPGRSKMCIRDRSLTNLSQILEAAGTSMDKVVKTTVFIQHMDDFAVMNEVYAQFFQGEVLPARSAVEVAKLPKGALVEIEAVAAL